MSAEETLPVEIMPSMQLLAEAAQEQEKLPEHEDEPTADADDDRSSSLSELEDRAGTEASEGPDDDLSEGEEDEEEEAGPEPEDDDEEEEDDNEPRAHNEAEDVAPEEDDEANDTEAETERLQDSPEKRRPSRSIQLRASDVLQIPEENLDQTSEISALSDSEPEGMSHMESIISSPRKRKRDEHDSDEEDTTVRSLKKVSRKLEDHVPDEDEEDERDRTRADRDEDDASEGRASSKEMSPEMEPTSHPEKDDDDEASVADEAEAEAEGADAEAEAHAKSEEDAAKKEAALQELRSIEKDFALLRDKLFAEKSQQLIEELDLLKNNAYAHAEFSVAAAAIQRRMEEQKQLAVVHFEFAVRNLQNVCLAERTMAHSQYMQTVREKREDALDKAGFDWYRIQRERRQNVDDGSEKRYHYHKDRAAQVAAQNAYNREVSILSGIQKHVGFPAAPTIEGVPEADRNDDLKKMGISTKPVHSVPISAPISSFPRQQPRADEIFLERNPWANPAQVQVYAAQALNPPNRQGVTANSTLATPAPAQRQGEPQPQNSASTIAISSVEQTPMSNQAQPGGVHRPQMPNSDGPMETPSRHTGVSRPDLAITEASPSTGSAAKNGAISGQTMTNGINGLTVAKTADDISPRSSPLKTAQVQAVPAGSG